MEEEDRIAIKKFVNSGGMEAAFIPENIEDPAVVIGSRKKKLKTASFLKRIVIFTYPDELAICNLYYSADTGLGRALAKPGEIIGNEKAKKILEQASQLAKTFNNSRI